MAKTFDNNDRKGLTESPCDDASRYTDGTLRLCLEEIAAEIKKADKEACDFWDAGNKSVGVRYFGVANGLAKAKAILLKHTKEKACSAEGTTPTSTPSV